MEASEESSREKAAAEAEKIRKQKEVLNNGRR
jgi:hypothetical protein